MLKQARPCHSDVSQPAKKTGYKITYRPTRFSFQAFSGLKELKVMLLIVQCAFDSRISSSNNTLNVCRQDPV